MSEETLTLIGVGATILIAVITCFGGLQRRLDRVADRLDARIEVQGERLESRIDVQGERIDELRNEVVGLQIAVARIEGPRQQFQIAR